jgi:hypothetical protein
LSGHPAIRIGHVCLIDDVESLDNPAEKKPRPALILFPSPYKPPPYKTRLVAVGISASPTESKKASGRLVQLPDSTRFQHATSGLDKPSWANPDWLLRSVDICRVLKILGSVRSFYTLEIWRLIKDEPGRLREYELRCPVETAGTWSYCRV